MTDLSNTERSELLRKLNKQSKENNKAKMAFRDDVKFIKKVAFLLLPKTPRRRISDAIQDALDIKKNPIESLRQEFPGSVFDSLYFYTRSKSTMILDMINKPTHTSVWKAFKERFIKERTPISMVFHAKGQIIPWVITNQRTGYIADTNEELLGAIIIHVRGNHQAVYVMPLNIYMKED